MLWPWQLTLEFLPGVDAVWAKSLFHKLGGGQHLHADGTLQCGILTWRGAGGGGRHGGVSWGGESSSGMWQCCQTSVIQTHPCSLSVWFILDYRDYVIRGPVAVVLRGKMDWAEWGQTWRMDWSHWEIYPFLIQRCTAACFKKKASCILVSS